MKTGEIIFAVLSVIGTAMLIIAIASCVAVAKEKDKDEKGNEIDSWFFWNWAAIWAVYTMLVLIGYGLAYMINKFVL